jgi:type II secretory ATPase GspE/PulE/Tfp pilus assembly ATPase PilB-like protein
MRFSDSQERKLLLAAWARRLALLLELSVPVVQAVEIAAQSVGELSEVLLPLCTRVRAGETVAEAMNDQPEEFPLFARVAVLAGEHMGRLPQALQGLADCFERERFMEIRPAAMDLTEGLKEPPAIQLTREILTAAAREGAGEVQLALEEGRLAVRHKLHGRWQATAPVEFSDPEAILRRVLMMAGIPYWIKDPAVGTMRVWIEQRKYEIGVRALPAEAGGWESLELTLRPLSAGAEEEEWA